jgi:selenocysteine lyase/cysteine desulfurase
MLDPQGKAFDYQLIEKDAGVEGISLRTGCFCNPGAGEFVNHLTSEEMAPFFGNPQPTSFRELYEIGLAHGKTTSALRVSLGIASNFADVWRFMDWAQTFRNRNAQEYNQRSDEPHHANAALLDMMRDGA